MIDHAQKDWLVERLAHLSEREVDAVKTFAMLWSLFEGTIMEASASPKRLLDLSAFLERRTNGNNPLIAYWPYFQNRYVQNGKLTDYFYGLKIRKNDHPDFVRNTLLGEESPSIDKVSCMLLIIYRYRNNLFHGEKWRYELRNQLSNFETANKFLNDVFVLVNPN